MFPNQIILGVEYKMFNLSSVSLSKIDSWKLYQYLLCEDGIRKSFKVYGIQFVILCLIDLSFSLLRQHQLLVKLLISMVISGFVCVLFIRMTV